MSKVFVSYASSDESVAMRLVGALEAKRLDCWISCRDVSKGGKYPGEIVKEIRESRAVVVLLSQAAFGSQNVLKEMSLANENRVMLIPIRLGADPVPDDFNYFLTLSQWIKVSGDSVGELRLDTAAREIIETVQSRPNLAASQRTMSASRAVKVEDAKSGFDLGAEIERESAARLSNEVAELAIETHKMKRAVADLEASVAKNRQLAVELDVEETGLRGSLARIFERRNRLAEELERQEKELKVNEGLLGSLVSRYGAAAQMLRKAETTFGSGKLLMASAAREAFFAGGNLPALRVETARAIAFPDPPYPREFVDVFGFLATAFGLSGARAFWASVSPARGLEPLQRYNKALSLLFDPAGSDSIQVAIRELDVLRRDPALAHFGRSDIAACIMFPSLRSKRDECRLQIWKPASEGGSVPRELPRLLGFVDGAIAALQWSQSNGVMPRDWRPALLSEVPF